jgi:prepilin-type N-terminal cleavage/methylation domain-containing protein
MAASAHRDAAGGREASLPLARAKAARRAGRAGMTLVEMMVGLSIFAVAMTVVFTFLVNSRRSYGDVSERVEYQQNLRAVMSLMTREIRTAGCDPAATGFERFTVAEATRLRCRADLNGNGAIEITEPAENVLYELVGDRLLRDNGSGAQLLLGGVTGLRFRYFDRDDNALLPPLSGLERTLIRWVEIQLAGLSDRDEPVTYTPRVLVRNG